MHPQDLANQCARAMNGSTLAGLPIEDTRVMLILPKGWKAPPKFPKRTLLCVNQRDERVYQINAMNLLAWLVGNKLATITITTNKEDLHNGNCNT